MTPDALGEACSVLPAQGSKACLPRPACQGPADMKSPRAGPGGVSDLLACRAFVTARRARATLRDAIFPFANNFAGRIHGLHSMAFALRSSEGQRSSVLSNKSGDEEKKGDVLGDLLGDPLGDPATRCVQGGNSLDALASTRNTATPLRARYMAGRGAADGGLRRKLKQRALFYFSWVAEKRGPWT